jgi:hypothetical protein
MILCVSFCIMYCSLFSTWQPSNAWQHLETIQVDEVRKIKVLKHRMILLGSYSIAVHFRHGTSYFLVSYWRSCPNCLAVLFGVRVVDDDSQDVGDCDVGTCFHGD